MGVDAWITLAVIAVLCVVFISERLPATLAMGGAVSVLYLSGVLDVGQAFGGFANIAPLTIAALYVIAGAADITGALGGITKRIFRPGFAGSERRALARTVLPASAVSGFLPNTPLVAIFAPRISAWARRTGRSPSRFLIPLSYAAILGGVITVLGTSTNLIISGLLDDAGQEPLGIFEITPVGLPLALVGTVAIVALAPLLVPTRRAPDEDLGSVDAPPPVRRRSARLVELAVLALVVLAGSGVVHLTRAALGVALALLVLRVVTPGEARRSINFDIVAMVAFSIGIGRAAHESGLAETMADTIIGTSSHWGDLGIVLGIAVTTIIATELLSNAAAAALMFPIAAATAIETGMELRPLAVVVLLLASCSFLTPIGYQTNTMVFGMGGYRFTDFSRLGIPLTLIALVVAVVAVPLAFPLR